jgi:hypothetical protein
MSVNEVDGNQQQATEGGGKQARYNRALRETLSSLAVVVKRQHQTRFEQKLLEAKEQVGAAARRGWVCAESGWVWPGRGGGSDPQSCRFG